MACQARGARVAIPVPGLGEPIANLVGPLLTGRREVCRQARAVTGPVIRSNDAPVYSYNAGYLCSIYIPDV